MTRAEWREPLLRMFAAAGLTARQRRFCLLAYCFGLTNAEIAARENAGLPEAAQPAGPAKRRGGAVRRAARERRERQEAAGGEAPKRKPREWDAVGIGRELDRAAARLARTFRADPGLSLGAAADLIWIIQNAHRAERHWPVVNAVPAAQGTAEEERRQRLAKELKRQRPPRNRELNAAIHCLRDADGNPIRDVEGNVLESLSPFLPGLTSYPHAEPFGMVAEDLVREAAERNADALFLCAARRMRSVELQA